MGARRFWNPRPEDHPGRSGVPRSDIGPGHLASLSLRQGRCQHADPPGPPPALHGPPVQAGGPGCARLRAHRHGGDDPAAAGVRARHPDRLQHHHVPGDPHGGHVCAPAPGVQRLPLDPADHHPVPPEPERGHHPADPALRRRAGPRGGRPHGPGLRPVRRGRQLRHRPGGVPDPAGDPVHRHQPRRRAHRRSDRPVHPGRHARQADGHRRRPERRLHRRGGGPPAAQGPGAPKPTSTAPWTAP